MPEQEAAQGRPRDRAGQPERRHRQNHHDGEPGHWFSPSGKKVLLIDADPQGDLTTCPGWQNQDSLSTTLATVMEKVIGISHSPRIVRAFCTTARA